MPSPEEITAALERWERVKSIHFYGMIEAGDALARLLRAANPPINSESSTETATPAVGEEPRQPSPIEVERVLNDAAVRSCRERIVDRLLWLESERKQALADVARLTEGLAFEQRRVHDHSENADFWMRAAQREKATLAAVRKVAENWHVEGEVSDPCANEVLLALDGFSAGGTMELTPTSDTITKAVSEEREAIAQLVEQYAGDKYTAFERAAGARKLARAIRARAGKRGERNE